MSIDERAYITACEQRNAPCNYPWLREIIEAYEAAKAAEQPCAGINKAALDQASAARKKYRADTPVSLYSIEGEDDVFVSAYLEAVKGDEQPLNAKEWGLGRGQAVITATLNAPREQPSQQPVRKPEIELAAIIYDCCHSLAQPSMQGKPWGEIKDYLFKNISKAMAPYFNTPERESGYWQPSMGDVLGPFKRMQEKGYINVPLHQVVDLVIEAFKVNRIEGGKS